jgi:NifU-like protein involved in Fe-S cluster formation
MDTRIASEHNLNEVCEDVMPHHFQVNDNRGQIALHKVADCVVSLPSQSACKEVDKKSVVQSLQTNKYKEMDKNSTNNGFWGKYLTESPTTDVESDVETDVETEGNPL